MEEFFETIENCEKNLYRGFTSTKSSDINWLNKCCGCLCQLFKQLHKIIVFEAKSSEPFIDASFLCVSQIIVGLNFMERILDIEDAEGVVLASLRQFFLDRIFVCLNRLKELATQIEKGEILEIEPFLTDCFDTVLDLLSPFCEYTNCIENIAERNATAMLDCAKIRSLIECIVSQTLSFANVLENKTALTQMCQRVLRECKALQDECDLGDKVPNEADRRHKANVLETAIYALENLINDSLLLLLFETFSDLRKVSLKALKDGENEEEMQDLVDSTIDRLMQIGSFAINFANDFKVSAMIKSTLASIEAMESHLCGEILRKYDEYHFELLEKHWTEETQRLEKTVQKIIDTSAFSACFEDIIEKSIAKLSNGFELKEAEILMSKVEVLSEHFQVNFDDKEKFKDFNLMRKECKAVLKMAETLDSKRIIKRLKILKTTVKRLKETSSTTQEELIKEYKDEKPVVLEILEPELRIVESGDEKILFDQEKFCGKEKSILYETSRRMKSRSTIDPNISWKVSKIIKEISMTPKKALTRKMSLRRKTLIRAQNYQEDLNVHTINDKSLSLQITEILNELTNISTNLASDGPRSRVQVLKDNKIRIHVIGDI